MMLRATFASVALVASFALMGCSAETSSSEPTAAEQDIIARPLANVKVETDKLSWGLAASYGGDRAHAAGIHAFRFEGDAGDEIVAKANTDTPGTLYILEETATGFMVIAKSNITGIQGEAKATLRDAGKYALAFELKITGAADPNAFFPESFGVSLTLAGKPASPTKQLSLKVRDIWTESTDFTELEDQFKAIDEKTLPAAALTEFKKLAAGANPKPIAATWKVGTATVFVVESRDDVSLLISFYDAQGALLGSANASEGSEIAWTK